MKSSQSTSVPREPKRRPGRPRLAKPRPSRPQESTADPTRLGLWQAVPTSRRVAPVYVLSTASCYATVTPVAPCEWLAEVWGPGFTVRDRVTRRLRAVCGASGRDWAQMTMRRLEGKFGSRVL